MVSLVSLSSCYATSPCWHTGCCTGCKWQAGSGSGIRQGTVKDALIHWCSLSFPAGPKHKPYKSQTWIFIWRKIATKSPRIIQPRSSDCSTTPMSQSKRHNHISIEMFLLLRGIISGISQRSRYVKYERITYNILGNKNMLKTHAEIPFKFSGHVENLKGIPLSQQG